MSRPTTLGGCIYPHDPIPGSADGWQPPNNPEGPAAFGQPAVAARPKLALAFLATVAVAAASAALWVLIVLETGYQLGFVALGVGWLTGAAAVAAAGGLRDARIQAMAVLATFVALVASEYFIVRSAIASFGFEIPLIVPVADILAIVNQSVREDPMVLLFWALGGYAAYRVTQPHRGATGQATPDTV